MTREDAILGIDRLATEDIVEHVTPEERSESATEPSEQDEGSFSEEITSVEVGEAERDHEERIDGAEAPRRRRRRRRGGRSREGAAADRDADGTAKDRPKRESRSAHAEKAIHDDADEDDDEGELDEAGVVRPNKNLHRECTPWAEAIGFIVDANMEARARSPGGGSPRGRWGKGERRS